MSSPSVSSPTPVPAPPGSPDEGVAWHYGDPFGEQRALVERAAVVDLSHREVVSVAGPDRLRWLHDLTTAHLLGLSAGGSRLALILSPHGHVEHEMHLSDDGTRTWIGVPAGAAEPLAAYLRSMQFLLRVEVAVHPELATVWEPLAEPDPAHPTWLVPGDYRIDAVETPAGTDRGGAASKYVPERPDDFVGREVLVHREQLAARMSGARPAGTWALEALRTAAAVPRIGFETDHRTLPHEVGWIGAAVHLAKGCYRGQEAVARVHNLGRPPRRLALAHLDGSAEILPRHGDPVLVNGREVGWVATAARHYELGPVATVMLKRSVDPQAAMVVRVDDQEVAATQQVVVAP